MITVNDFTAAITGMIECLPFQKVISENGLIFAWLSFPEPAKQQLQPIHLAYACTQRILDPEPDLNRAIHIQLLTYLYPVINGVLDTDHGLRADLADRIKDPHRFHPLTKRHEAQLPPLLSASYGPPKESIAQRRNRLEQLAQLTNANHESA